MSATRRCPSCKKYKPLTEFRIRGPSAGKRAGQIYGSCKACYKGREADAFNTDDPGLFLIHMMEWRRRKTTKDWDLTSIDVIHQWHKQKGICALTGIQMTNLRGIGIVHTNASIDRIDSSRGYTPDNIQLTCQMANNMKSTLSIQELLEWCESIIKHQKKLGTTK